MLTIPSLVVLGVACLIVFISQRPQESALQARPCAHHRASCLTVLALGCAVRLAMLGSLPAGLSAEEALVGVQAKALFATGGFYPTGRLIALLPQWTGEAAGPLLAALTAPFAGLMGISPWSVRLPLTLLSIAAMPAAYALGCMLSGKRAGRFMLVVYALCPYFVLGARTTASAQAAVFLLPIALALLTAGLRRPALLYAGMAALALTAYAQRLMLAIAPACVVGALLVAVCCGKSRVHALVSGALGLALCMPAVMTVYVNLAGLPGMQLGPVEIPAAGLFDGNLIASAMGSAEPMEIAVFKVWGTVIGGLLQAVGHENIDAALFLPGGMLALTAVSLPLIALGAGSLVLRCLEGGKMEAKLLGGRIMVSVLFAIAFVLTAVFADVGSYSIGGSLEVYDHANLFLFAALLMTAGFVKVQRSCAVCTRLLAALLVVCFAGLGVHLFGGSYQANANTYFAGFAEACVRARELQEATGAKVNVTSTVYPHMEPDAAARMMYLYATDADMQQEQNVEVVYAQGLEWLDPEQVYIVAADDIYDIDWGDMNYEEFGNYVVLSTAHE